MQTKRLKTLKEKNNPLPYHKMATYKLITAPSVSPLSLADAKVHLRVDAVITRDDDYITALIDAAADVAQMHTNRQFITAVYDAFFDSWPTDSYLYIGKNPVQTIDSVKYTDTTGATITLTEGTDYEVDTASEPARVYIKTTPALYDGPAPIAVRFTAGYGNAGTNVPTALIQAMQLLVGNFYEMRQDAQIGQSLAEIPTSSRFLLNRYKIHYV
jgi:uncharacterized phiE125 gp8 family phage protein